MESVWPVSKLSIESVSSRRELVANSCTHRRRRCNATKQFHRVGGVYWALAMNINVSAFLYMQLTAAYEITTTNKCEY